MTNYSFTSKNSTSFAFPSENSTTYSFESKTLVYEFLLNQDGGFMLTEASGQIVLNDGANTTYSFPTKN